MSALKQQLTRSVHEEIGMRIVGDLCDQLGIPKVFPEPEVARSMLAEIRNRTLASIIAKLLTENEPMLRAHCDGAAVSVRDPDGNVMRFVVGEAIL